MLNFKFKKIRNTTEVVLFIFRSCGLLAGTERVILNWCKHVDHNKTKIIICTHRGISWDIFKKELPNVILIEFPFDDAFKAIKTFIKSSNLILKLKPTKIILSLNGMEEFFWYMLPAWILTRGNIYISHHSFLAKIEKSGNKRWFGLIPGVRLWRIRIAIKFYLAHILAKKILSISREAKDLLKNYWKIPSNKIIRGCRGVDKKIFYPNSKMRDNLIKHFNLNEKTIIFIAINRISKQKRMDRLLGAFLLLLKKHNNIFLLIAGDGKYKMSFEKRTNNSLLNNKIKFIGFQENIATFLQGSDYLLLASDFEGEANVIKEAMACGVIPIITDSYGPRGISNSIFISQRNVFKFAQKINYVLSLPKEKTLDIRINLVEEVREKYNLSKCVLREINTFDLLMNPNA